MTIKLEEGWTTVFLLAALVSVAAWGVEASAWTVALWVGGVAAVTGVFAGLALAKSRFREPVAALFGAVYGLFVVGFCIASILKGDWHRRTVEVIIRVNNWLYYALHGGTSRDILPFPVFVGLVFWIIGLVGAWAIFRRAGMWAAVLPGGLILLINAYYSAAANIELYLAAYLVLALILMARLNLLAREREWQAKRVAYNSEVRFEFLRAGLVAAVGVVFAASVAQNLTPAVANAQAVATWNQVNGAWSNVRENFERLFNAVRNPGIQATDFYGDSLSLGGANSLSDRPVLDVAVGPVDDDVEGESIQLQPVARFYWRAVAYQEYGGGRWQAGDAREFREVNPSRPLIRLPGYRMRQDVKATFITHQPNVSRLYILPQPKSVDRTVSYETLILPNNAWDPASVRAQTLLQGDDRRYTVVASVSFADMESLRDAGENYPPWVKEHFLQLPGDITQRTRDLARQIVSDARAASPYDKAQAITDWLRKNITYDLGINAPPDGREPVDWFLFETQHGYCNYYASAEVILLRALGIPARMSVGFSEGTFDRSTGVYKVIERNAHAWPEVFFPDYGWVEFEPTGSEPPLLRPERQAVAPTPDPNRTPDAAPTRRPEEDLRELENVPGAQAAIDWAALLAQIGTVTGTTLGITVIVSLIVLAILVRAGLVGLDSLGAPGRSLLRWVGRAVPSAVSQAYAELERAGRWLGLKLPEHITPYERAAALNEVLPDMSQSVNTITQEYVEEQYGPTPSSANGSRAQSAWRTIRLKVWREGVIRFWRAWTESDLSRASRRLRMNSSGSE